MGDGATTGPGSRRMAKIWCRHGADTEQAWRRYGAGMAQARRRHGAGTAQARRRRRHGAGFNIVASTGQTVPRARKR